MGRKLWRQQFRVRSVEDDDGWIARKLEPQNEEWPVENDFKWVGPLGLFKASPEDLNPSTLDAVLSPEEQRSWLVEHISTLLRLRDLDVRLRTALRAGDRHEAQALWRKCNEEIRGTLSVGMGHTLTFLNETAEALICASNNKAHWLTAGDDAEVHENKNSPLRLNQVAQAMAVLQVAGKTRFARKLTKDMAAFFEVTPRTLQRWKDNSSPDFHYFYNLYQQKLRPPTTSEEATKLLDWVKNSRAICA